jgi:hypothetical protein
MHEPIIDSSSNEEQSEVFKGLTSGVITNKEATNAVQSKQSKTLTSFKPSQEGLKRTLDLSGYNEGTNKRDSITPEI